jgi:hypothetical protein
MSAVHDGMVRILAELDGKSLADAFAELVEHRINMRGTADEYFASLLRLPSPLLELYAPLIFNSHVCMDGLADTIPLYDTNDFMTALRDGCEMLDQSALFSIIDRAREHLRNPGSTALMSDAPNVALDRETGNIHSTYFANNKQLMIQIAQYLQVHRDRVLIAASELDGLHG